MGWRDVYRLLELYSDNGEKIPPEKLAAATAGGKGPPDVQQKIARAEYERRYRKKIQKDQKNEW